MLLMGFLLWLIPKGEEQWICHEFDRLQAIRRFGMSTGTQRHGDTEKADRISLRVSVPLSPCARNQEDYRSKQKARDKMARAFANSDVNSGYRRVTSWHRGLRPWRPWRCGTSRASWPGH